MNCCPAAAAAAAKSLQSCLTLCDPIDGSPPGPPSLGFSRQEHWSGNCCTNQVLNHVLNQVSTPKLDKSPPELNFRSEVFYNDCLNFCINVATALLPNWKTLPPWQPILDL